MRKQILTAVGVLLLGSTVAFANPQQQQTWNRQDIRAPQTTRGRQSRRRSAIRRVNNVRKHRRSEYR